ncbi:MAG: HDIG domain-containing protein [Nanoarchaeota archaeon]|nr:HDIG domain-containing protein [Nanoarchaeota archaeon]
MNLPTKKECLELLKKHGLSEKKIQHSVLVTKVAVFLARKFIKKGEKIDLNLIEVGGLLHDIGDSESEDKINHGDVGVEILKKINLDQKIINIVRKHILKSVLDDAPKTWEEKIVFYADKRVNSREVRIISIEERTKKWPNKFPKHKESIIEAIKIAKNLEKELFSHLDFKPEELKDLIK